MIYTPNIDYFFCMRFFALFSVFFFLAWFTIEFNVINGFSN